MKNIERSPWDPCKKNEPMEIKEYNITLPPSPNFSVDENVTVVARYKNTMTIIRIEHKLSETEFEGIITGFDPPAETSENLSVNDKVAIDKDHICAILRM